MKPIIEIMGPLGVGGILAVSMFMYYRKDMMQWKDMSTLLITAVQTNTEALTSLKVLVEALHRRLDRDHRE